MGAVAVTLYTLGELSKVVDDNNERDRRDRIELQREQAGIRARRQQICAGERAEWRNDKIEVRHKRRDLKRTRSFLYDRRNAAETPLLYELAQQAAGDTKRELRHERQEARDSRPPKFCENVN